MEEIYVLVFEKDGVGEEKSAIVLEQYIDDGKASLKAIKQRLQYFRDTYGDTFGKIRIARLTFIDEEESHTD